MSGENLCATTSGPMGQSKKVQSLPYVDPKQPGMELTWSDGSRSHFMVRVNPKVKISFYYHSSKSFKPIKEF